MAIAEQYIDQCRSQRYVQQHPYPSHTCQPQMLFREPSYVMATKICPPLCHVVGCFCVLRKYIWQQPLKRITFTEQQTVHMPKLET
jgi:hypothetical protein